MVILMAMIPPQIYSEAWEGRTITVDDYFSAVDIERYGNTFNYTLNGTGASLVGGIYEYTVDVGGHTIRLWYPEANHSTFTYIINIFHCEVWGPNWVVNMHSFDFYYHGVNLGPLITEAQLNSSAADMTYEMMCNHVDLDLYFAYNDTLYETPVEAFDHNELLLLIGVRWDQLATSMSAWDLIAMVMLFQIPGVHWVINGFIAGPIYLCMIYVAVVLVLKILDVIIPL